MATHQEARCPTEWVSRSLAYPPQSFFEGDKVNTMVSEILLTLKSLHYSGDCKNFNFDKYCTAHVDQHNCHAALSEYVIAPLEENMKIHYFEDRITDLSFASVKSTIIVDCQKFKSLML
jgi:hypothetical protein